MSSSQESDLQPYSYKYKIPFYFIVLTYIWKIRKVPYFMKHQEFKYEHIGKNILFSIVGIKAVDLIFKIVNILN